jgi:hypothetical protein
VPLHMLKLCVGCDSIEDLEDWILEKRRRVGPSARADEHLHITRMVPKRVDELLDDGSLFWVIKGQLACRQRLMAIRPFKDTEGISRCHLVLEPVVIPVAPRPYRPFQGWRYLDPKDAPDDLGAGGLDALPEALRRELVDLGLL